MNNIQKELEDAREEQRLNIPAKRIKEKIEVIPSDIGRLDQMVLGLLQKHDYHDEVEVQLDLYSDKVVINIT